MNFALEKAEIEFDPQVLMVKDAIVVIEKAGYRAFISQEGLDRESQSRDKEVKDLNPLYRCRYFIRTADVCGNGALPGAVPG